MNNLNLAPPLVVVMLCKTVNITFGTGDERIIVQTWVTCNYSVARGYFPSHDTLNASTVNKNTKRVLRSPIHKRKIMGQGLLQSKTVRLTLTGQLGYIHRWSRRSTGPGPEHNFHRSRCNPDIAGGRRWKFSLKNPILAFSKPRETEMKLNLNVLLIHCF